MPALNIESSIHIEARADKILQAIVDFNTWPIWSPWLYIEPETQLSYQGQAGQSGHGYRWEGKKTGSGSMTLTSISAHRVECNLQFIKPFKSKADVAFTLEASGSDSTRLTWLMASSLPFFMFWMKDTMTGMIRADYGRGLLMLKDYIELGEVPSRSKLLGKVEMESAHYLGLRTSTSIDTLATSMGAQFASLGEAVRKQALTTHGRPFSLYEKIDLKQFSCTYIAAQPVEKPPSPEAPFVKGVRLPCEALKLIHNGPYRHLGSAWAKLMAEARHHKFKPSKKLPPFEIYLNDPGEVDEGNVITELYFPLRPE